MKTRGISSGISGVEFFSGQVSFRLRTNSVKSEGNIECHFFSPQPAYRGSAIYFQAIARAFWFDFPKRIDFFDLIRFVQYITAT